MVCGSEEVRSGRTGVRTAAAAAPQLTGITAVDCEVPIRGSQQPTGKTSFSSK